MFFFNGNKEKKKQRSKVKKDSILEKSKELFLGGKFPVVTTDTVEGKRISKVLGLVCSRAYDADDAFFGMASRALSKGAHAIVGYSENVAFHPDGTRYFSCYGTAVMFAWEPNEKYGAALMGRKGLESLATELQLNKSPAVHTQLSVKTSATETPSDVEE